MDDKVLNTNEEGTPSQPLDNKEKTPVENIKMDSNQDNGGETSKEREELEALRQRNVELNDKYLRLYSDFENFRKRSTKERMELYKYAGEEIISHLLPVMDDFERALKSIEKTGDINALKQGVELIYDKFKRVLAQQGLKELEIINGEFNADFHNAISRIAAPSEDQKGKIIDVIEKGYYLNDKVIRHAKVVVGS